MGEVERVHPEWHWALAFSESQADGVDILEIAADEACDARGEDGRVIEGEDFCEALVVVYIHGDGLSQLSSGELIFGYPNSIARYAWMAATFYPHLSGIGISPR